MVCKLLVAYTYSKLIDDSSADNSNGGTIGLHQDVYDRAADRAVSEQNIPQRFVASFVADLPFGKGKAIGSNWNTLTNDILGGWQVNGILTISSGLAVALVDSSDNSQSDFGGIGASQRPNTTGTSPNLPGIARHKLNSPNGLIPAYSRSRLHSPGEMWVGCCRRLGETP